MEILESLGKVPIFKGLREESLKTLSARAEFKNFSPNEDIVRFGEQGTFFGLIVSGEVEAGRVYPDGTRERFAVIRSGEYFGEMSLMTGEPASADVISLTSSRTIMIPHEDVSAVIAREPALAASLAKMITKRLTTRQRNLEERKRLAEARRAQDDPYDLKKFPLPEGGQILTMNCGSSSVKYRLFDSADPHGGISGQVDRIGLPGTRHVSKRGPETIEEPVTGKGYAPAFEAMVRALGGKDSLKNVKAVGHRVVHGGEKFAHAAVITPEVMEEIRKCERLAPLHIPANIAGIEEAMRLMPSIPHVAVFDTGFHRTLPRHAFVYGIPYKFYTTNNVRRFGFHGTSHKFVSLQTASFLKRPFNELRLITCHLGNGASLAAIDHGRCVDTSMGMTPLEGLIMGTRSGDLDPGALLHIMREQNLSPAQMENILMKESGILGVSGVSSDMREVLEAAAKGNDTALLAIQTYCYRVKKYIGSFWAALGELDALVFTGGIGENSAEVRARICQGLSGIGVVLDEEANRSPSFDGRGAAVVSTEESPVKILVVPTDEERMIARETARAISRGRLMKSVRVAHDATITIGVSAHHVHLSKKHVEALFGRGHTLTAKSPLSQPGQFACAEQVTLVGPKGSVERIRVLGPERKETQVEISRTEEFRLGIDAPVRMSGDLDGTPGLTITAPGGSVTLQNGVICAQRHIHMNPEDSLRFGVHDRDIVMVEVEGDRSLIFGDVIIRVDPTFKLEMHIDTDEANAAEVNTGMRARLHSIESRVLA